MFVKLQKCEKEIKHSWIELSAQYSRLLYLAFNLWQTYIFGYVLVLFQDF